MLKRLDAQLPVRYSFMALCAFGVLLSLFSLVVFSVGWLLLIVCAALVEFSDHVGAPLQEGMLLVHNILIGVNLRSRISIGAAGKVVSAFDLVRLMALGADWCNAGRGFMMAPGCIQAQTCHTGICPTGVTTQDPVR